MYQKPKLKSFLTVFPISETTWGLRGGMDELWRIKLRDQHAFATFSSVLPYLNGSYSVEDIHKELASKDIGEREVSELLERMEAASLLEEAHRFDLSEEEAARFSSQIAFFSRYTGEGGAKYQARLRSGRIGLIGNGRLGQSLRSQLLESGCGEVAALGPNLPENGAALPNLFVVAQETHDSEVLEAMDRMSKRAKVPWLLVRALEATVGWVGPLFVPDETACYRSLEARLRGNLSFFPEYEAFHRHLRQAGASSPPCGGLHAFFEVLSGIAVVEIIKFLCDTSVPRLAGRFLTLNLNDWEVEVHDVLKVPHLGLDVSEPELFAWKEMPQDDIEQHRDGTIYARRS